MLKTQAGGVAAAGNEGPEAVTWLQKAFAIADELDDGAGLGIPELKAGGVSALLIFFPYILNDIQIAILRTMGVSVVYGKVAEGWLTPFS